MDRKQAEQLAERIRNEVPNVIATVKQVTWVARGMWAIAVVARGSNFLLGEVESPSEWDALKRVIQNHP